MALRLKHGQKSYIDHDIRYIMIPDICKNPFGGYTTHSKQSINSKIFYSHNCITGDQINFAKVVVERFRES